MFNDYQQEACSHFKPAKELTPTQARLLDWSMGLGGESGEVLDLLKHAIFHADTNLNKMELAKELGDVLWYTSAIATTCGIDLADIAALNNAKLKHRYGGAAYSVEASANRHATEKALTDTAIYRCLSSRINNDHNAPLSIIVIGPDGSGKTTLTTKLSEKMDMKRIKCDYRQENKPELAVKMLTEDVDVIYDRFYYPDELVYCAVKNIPLDKQYKESLYGVWDILKLVNPVFIYVDANLSTLIERSSAWADDYVSTEQLSSIKTEYEDFLATMDSRGVPIIQVDTTNIAIDTPGYIGMIQYIIEQLNYCRAKYGTSNISSKEVN